MAKFLYMQTHWKTPCIFNTIYTFYVYCRFSLSYKLQWIYGVEFSFFLATSNDSVEGIVYNVNQSVIMTGQYVEEEEVEKDKINRMGLWFKPWFYKYVEKFLEKVKMSKNHFFSLIFFKKNLLTTFFLSGRNGRICSNSSFSSSNFL